MRFQGGKANFIDPTSSLDYKISTKNGLDLPCVSSGSCLGIEMHHLKHIKTLNSKLDSFGKMMAKINRKQVPLCRKCHMDVHNGIYSGKSLKNFSKNWTTVKIMKD